MTLPQWTHKLWSIVVLSALLFSPFQPIATANWPITPQTGAMRPANQPFSPVSPSGLYRTTVILRNSADWKRLEQLGVVVIDPSPASLVQHGGELGWGAAVVLADEAQLEALARLRFRAYPKNHIDRILGMGEGNALAHP